MQNSIRSLVLKSLGSERGSVAIQIGLAMTAIIGMVALGTEITFLLYKQRQMQSVADSAALGGATALATGYPADLTLEARAIAASLGFVGGAEGVGIVVNNPPLSGPYVSNAKAVEVIISQPQTLSMVTLFRSGLFDVGARAVAIAGGGGGGKICILQYGDTAPNPAGIRIDNGAVVNLSRAPETATCGVAANSTDSRPSLLVSGGSTLNTQSVSVSGTTQTSGGGVINSIEPIEINQPALADPYADISPPSFSGCAGGTNASYGHGTWTLNPGVYCGNLTFTEDAIVTLNPGVYVVGGTGATRRTLTFGGNSRVTGTGVTFYLTRSSGSNYVRVTATNSATVTLIAPTAGTLQGLVFFGDRNAPRSLTNAFIGDARVSITGAIYFPSQTVQILNSSRNQSDCTHLIAAAVDIRATTGWSFKNDCAGSGIKPIGGGTSQTALVE